MYCPHDGLVFGKSGVKAGDAGLFIIAENVFMLLYSVFTGYKKQASNEITYDSYCIFNVHIKDERLNLQFKHLQP